MFDSPLILAYLPEPTHVSFDITWYSFILKFPFPLAPEYWEMVCLRSDGRRIKQTKMRRRFPDQAPTIRISNHACRANRCLNHEKSNNVASKQLTHNQIPRDPHQENVPSTSAHLGRLEWPFLSPLFSFLFSLSSVCFLLCSKITPPRSIYIRIKVALLGIRI